MVFHVGCANCNLDCSLLHGLKLYHRRLEDADDKFDFQWSQNPYGNRHGRAMAI